MDRLTLPSKKPCFLLAGSNSSGVAAVVSGMVTMSWPAAGGGGGWAWFCWDGGRRQRVAADDAGSRLETLTRGAGGRREAISLAPQWKLSQWCDGGDGG